MRNRGRQRLLPGAALIVVLASCASLAAARAFSFAIDPAPVACRYVSSGVPGPKGNRLEIERTADFAMRGYGGITLSRDKARIIVAAITLGRIDCSGRTPTVNNLDTIEYDSNLTRTLYLNLQHGPLGPGASEKGRGGEIEIRFGTLGAQGPGKPIRLSVVSGRRANVLTIETSPASRRSISTL